MKYLVDANDIKPERLATIVAEYNSKKAEKLRALMDALREKSKEHQKFLDYHNECRRRAWFTTSV